MLSFPRGTEMFQFPRLPLPAYVFSRQLHGIIRAGFSHSGISGSTPVSGSPKLIAACYALHRPSAPRNPPYALKRLTIILFSVTSNDIQLSKNRRPYGRLPDFLKRIPLSNGGERDRTDDPLRARQVLSQLSYTPVIHLPLISAHSGPSSSIGGPR